MLCVVAGSFPVAAAQAMYLSRDTSLRVDPSANAAPQTWVPAGAPFSVLSCEEDWCFGQVFGSGREGWVARSELSELPPEAPRQMPARIPADELQRLVLANDLHGGTGYLRRSDGVLLKRARAWHLGVGVGRVLRESGERRLYGEALLGYTKERRTTTAGEALSTWGLWGAGGLKYHGTYNEYFGFGAAMRATLRFGTPSEGFEKSPSWFLLSVGPVITHELGLSQPKLVEWRPSLSFNSSEIFVGLGMDLIF